MEIQLTLPDEFGSVYVIASPQRITLCKKAANGDVSDSVSMGTPEFLRLAEKLQDLLDD